MVITLMNGKTPKTSDPAKLLAEFAKIGEEQANLERRKRELAQKLIEAGQALGGVVATAKPAPTKTKKAKRIKVRERTRTQAPVTPKTRKSTSWVAVIYRALKEADRGLTYPELRQAILKTHLGPTLERTDKAFYGAIGKMAKPGFVVRHNGRIYADDVFRAHERAVKAGNKDDPPPPASTRASPARDVIVSFLRNVGHGVPISRIFEVLEKAGMEFPDKNSKTSIYNLVSRLVERDILMKDSRGNIMIWPLENETPNVGASGVSH